LTGLTLDRHDTCAVAASKQLRISHETIVTYRHQTTFTLHLNWNLENCQSQQVHHEPERGNGCLGIAVIGACWTVEPSVLERTVPKTTWRIAAWGSL